MNAKDRLRLYLEQRRELGESELVLDSLSVETVLKMIGAPLKSATSNLAATSALPSTISPTVETFAPPSTPVPNDRGANDVSISAEASPNAPPPAPPAEPERRFSENAPVDWRAALRDLAPSGLNASSPAPSVATPSKDNSVGASNSFPAWVANLGIPFGFSHTPPTNLPTSVAANAAQSLGDLAATIATCRACSLGAMAINPVPGEGDPNADFVCVGEAPGQTEDETGRPFIGPAGQLLTKILGAIQLSREEVFICNVLKHRPPGNRNPQPDEVRACTPYLTRQLALVKPKVILALGTFGAQTLLNTAQSLGKLRGQIHLYEGIPVIVTYHPSALLRNEAWKRPTWDDVKLARRILDAARLNTSESRSS